jgi:hypothetical protein
MADDPLGGAIAERRRVGQYGQADLTPIQASLATAEALGQAGRAVRGS